MKKWKIAGLLASQAALTYAVFITCIHEPRSSYQQVEEALREEKSILHNKESKINSIIFHHFEHPTTITIEQVRKNIKQNPRPNSFDLLSAVDATFLTDIANGK